MKHFALLMLFLMSSIRLAAAAEAPSQRDAILAVLKAQQEAWNQGDLPGVLAVYQQSPNMTFALGGAMLKGFDKLKARYEEVYKANRAMGKLAFEDVEVTTLSDTAAYAIGKFKVEQPGSPAANGIFTLIWMKDGDGAWKIVHDQRGVLPPRVASSGKPDGLVKEDLVEGTGREARSGNSVTVHYTGWLTDGRKFDSSVDRGEPFKFQLGAGQVIPGWDQGVAGMKVGGKRKLTIPPQLGYGSRGAGGVIPPNATLIFEVELLDVR